MLFRSVHGAARGALQHVREVIEIETGSATDNPLIFSNNGPETGEVLSGGNFHGAPLGLALDYAATGGSMPREHLPDLGAFRGGWPSFSSQTAFPWSASAALFIPSLWSTRPRRICPTIRLMA